MVSFTISALTLGLAALGSSAPTDTTPVAATTTRSPSQNPPAAFPLHLAAPGYEPLPLVAVKGAAIGNYNLVFKNPAVYYATPAYLNNTALAFYVDGQDLAHPYTMNFGDTIQGPGDLNDVTAIYGFNEAERGLGFADNGVLEYVDGRSIPFFACKGTLNGVEQLSLKIGQAEVDGSAPEGCVVANIVKPN
ncbi:hypothetical protein VTL71DRAFT_2180 [Oculimacula yallundae]|uniref:Uncharacterized protein n=1 Tax=Oculimacula yallundae TaxID=86028 RepID=A0ABR4CA39_9HELO